MEFYFLIYFSEIEFLFYCYNYFYLGWENKIWKMIDGGCFYILIVEFGNDDQLVM